MVHGKLAHKRLVATILAGVVVPEEDVVAIEANHVLPAFQRDIFNQTKNPGNRNAYGNGSNHLIRALYNFDLAGKEELNGFLPRNDLQGLK